jgi:replication factor C subunit 3/5
MPCVEVISCLFNVIVVEKYTKNVRFCLICNYVNKIIPALQSRCTKFRFAPLDTSAISERIETIASGEKITLTAEGKEALLLLAKGDMRKVLNILQSTHAAFGIVDLDSVYKWYTHLPNPQYRRTTSRRRRRNPRSPVE